MKECPELGVFPKSRPWSWKWELQKTEKGKRKGKPPYPSMLTPLCIPTEGDIISPCRTVPPRKSLTDMFALPDWHAPTGSEEGDPRPLSAPYFIADDLCG